MNRTTPNERHDEQQPIDDVPMRRSLRPLTCREPTRRQRQQWAEAERLSRERIWEPILGLPHPDGGDDMEPRPPSPVEDKYAGG